MNVGIRMWIEENGEVVFGDGRALILRKAIEEGSLQGAARALGMSYRALWGKIKAMERRTGIAFVEASRGRKGGVTLTPEGLSFLERYETMRVKLQERAEELLRAYFPEGIVMPSQEKPAGELGMRAREDIPESGSP